MRYTRQQVLDRLHAQIQAGKPIIGAGAGTGISAKFAEAGGALITRVQAVRFASVPRPGGRAPQPEASPQGMVARPSI